MPFIVFETFVSSSLSPMLLFLFYVITSTFFVDIMCPKTYLFGHDVTVCDFTEIGKVAIRAVL